MSSSSNYHQPPAHKPDLVSSSDLPSSRKGKVVKRTSAPLYHTPLKNVLYGLGLVVLMISAFYSWRITVWKREAGGWWNLLFSSPSSSSSSTSSKTTTPSSDYIESKISELASALGIEPATLASAVRDQVPTATLSSIAAAATAEGTSEVIKHLVQKDPKAAAASEKANSFTNKLGGIVGMDEPAEGLD